MTDAAKDEAPATAEQKADVHKEVASKVEKEMEDKVIMIHRNHTSGNG